MNTSRPRTFVAVFATALMCAIAGFASGADAATNNSIQPNEGSAIFAAFADPAAPPPGVNNWSCQLSTAHPRPVVLIPGTFSNMENDYGALGPILANDGYCVFSLNYGGTPGAYVQATGSVANSASQVSALINQVRGNYAGVKVDLVGHSQGGLIAEYVAKVLGQAPGIADVVALSPTTHGTTLDGLTLLAGFFPGANQALVGGTCAACYDQEAGSGVINTVDNGPIAQPGVSYTVIETRNEYVVTPVGSSFINEPGVTNIYVQDLCQYDSVDHADLSYDNTTIRLVLNALDPAHATAPNCNQTYPAFAAQQ